MLDEYKIDPAFNKNLAFAYQPPPEINLSKLPALPRSWLDDFQFIVARSQGDVPGNIFEIHLSQEFKYRGKALLLKELKLIYHRLQGHLDGELGTLSADDYEVIISKLTEDILYCSEGFHNRVNIIVDSFYKPRNLAQLLHCVRKEIVNEVASTITNEVHAWNRITAVAANDGLGIKTNHPDDNYLGTLPVVAVRRILKKAFYKKFTPFNLPCLLISSFMAFIPELEIEKEKENGLCLGMTEKIVELIKKFLPDYINEIPEDPNNWKKYFIISYNKEDTSLFYFSDVDWEKMYRSFFHALSDQNYFTNPEINTLIDSAYDSLFLQEKAVYTPPGKIVSDLFKQERYSDLVNQLEELEARFPNYYQRVIRDTVFSKYCSEFLDYLTIQLKISRVYQLKVMQSLHLIVCLDKFCLGFNRRYLIIEKIANAFIVKNRSGCNLLMLATTADTLFVDDILSFIERNIAIIGFKLVKKMLFMKNKYNVNALMMAATYRAHATKVLLNFIGKYTPYFDPHQLQKLLLTRKVNNANVLILGASNEPETVAAVLNFLTAHVEHFTNEALIELLMQRRIEDNYSVVTLIAIYHPHLMKKVLSFLSNHIKFDREILHKFFFTEELDSGCTTLMLAAKNQEREEATCAILKFFSTNIEYFDPDTLRKIFLKKDKEGLTLLITAARYESKILQAVLAFLDEHQPFPPEYLPELFLEKDSANYNCLMYATERRPGSVPVILNYITDHLEVFKPHLLKILFSKNEEGHTSLMLSHIRSTSIECIINFIYAHPEAMPLPTLGEIFVEKCGGDFTMLMLAARDQPTSLKVIFDFIETHAELFTDEILRQLIVCVNELKYNALMLSARNQYDSTKQILNFMHKRPGIFSLPVLTQIFSERDDYGFNVLMIAASHKIKKSLELLFRFLSDNINHFSVETIEKLVYEPIHDKVAAIAVFFTGRYDFFKTILSTSAKFDDRTALDALLKFTDDNIEFLGIRIFLNLLTEKDNDHNYIFNSAAVGYPLTMKKTLVFITNSENTKVLAPVQDMFLYFLFNQLVGWSIKTADDERLLDAIILNASPLLLTHFKKDYFAKRPDNLEIVTNKLFSSYLNELRDRHEKKASYAANLSFFNFPYSVAKKLDAAQSLDSVLNTPTSDKTQALAQLKSQYYSLSQSRLGNLFAAYQEVERLKAKDNYAPNLENDSVHCRQARLA